MKPTQEQKDQIRKMVEEEYPHNHFEINRVQRKAAVYGAEALLERLDIDQAKFLVIMLRYKENQIDWREAKDSILKTIILKTDE